MAVYENEASLASPAWASLPPGDPREGPVAPVKPGTPVSGTKRKPRVGSALAASSMAWGIVRKGMRLGGP